MDVVIGCGWGEESGADEDQGANYVPGNRYLAAADLAATDVRRGGRYVVAQRTPGRDGAAVLREAAGRAARDGARLLGLFGAAGGIASHLPFQTADGGYDPVAGVNPAEAYSAADVTENPTLAEMTAAALDVLQGDPDGFWLMVEAGDVDWANHDNNIDNAIGSVLAGDAAFRAIVHWVEARDAWNETVVIVTADHGHLLVLREPEALAGGAP
jgi:alkaline phosphatase